MFNDFHNIKNYKVYQYTFLDELSFVKSPEFVFDLFLDFNDKHSLHEYINEVEKLFKTNNWEGDGKLGIIWLPPFVGVGIEDTWGTYIWHVKQSNNGISFLASPYELNFKSFPNDDIDFISKKGVPINIVYDDVLQFLERLKNDKNELISNYPENKYLEKRLLYFVQNEIISNFSLFLDDCYLQILLEVLQNDNKSRLKLRKISTKIDLSQFNMDEDGIIGSGSEWLTLQLLIADIWKSYKYEPFETKIGYLFDSVEFKIKAEEKEFLKKHILIRNCIQHHDGELNAHLLKTIGKDSIKIKNSSAKGKEIKKGNEIILSKEEVLLLFEFMNKIVMDFNAQIEKRVKTKNWKIK
jgi:hypothetical protein